MVCEIKGLRELLFVKRIIRDDFWWCACFNIEEHAGTQEKVRLVIESIQEVYG